MDYDRDVNMKVGDYVIILGICLKLKNKDEIKSIANFLLDNPYLMDEFRVIPNEVYNSPLYKIMNEE